MAAMNYSAVTIAIGFTNPSDFPNESPNGWVECFENTSILAFRTVPMGGDSSITILCRAWSAIWISFPFVRRWMVGPSCYRRNIYDRLIRRGILLTGFANI